MGRDFDEKPKGILRPDWNVRTRANLWKWGESGKSGGLYDLSREVGEPTYLSESRTEILKNIK
jgi:hypothetical protein